MAAAGRGRNAVAGVAFAACVGAAGWTMPAGAQTPENPTRVSFDHDGKDVQGFALYVRRDSGAVVRIDLGMIRPDASGHYATDLPKLFDGVYTAEIAAYNVAGESPRVSVQPAAFLVSGRGPEPPPPPPPVVQPKATAPAAKAGDQAPAAADAPKAKPEGIFKRLWGGLIGADKPEQPKTEKPKDEKKKKPGS